MATITTRQFECDLCHKLTDKQTYKGNDTLHQALFSARFVLEPVDTNLDRVDAEICKRCHRSLSDHIGFLKSEGPTAPERISGQLQPGDTVEILNENRFGDVLEVQVEARRAKVQAHGEALGMWHPWSQLQWVSKDMIAAQ